MSEFRMPSLGADMEVGTIVEWRVAPGDTVHRGDIVAVVDTEKSDIEVEIFEDGVVEELVVPPGIQVPVGTVLARLASATAPPAPPAGAPPAPAPVTAPVRPSRPLRGRARVPAGPSTPPIDRVRASPLARRQAATLGIDLAALAGSGPGGAVLVGDLQAPAPAPEPDGAEPSPREPGGRQAALRRAIGRLMVRSKREIPHYYVATTVELTEALRWLVDTNSARPVTGRLLPAALLLKAAALGAREVPAVNGFFVDDGFQPATAVHLGVAVSLRGGGLVAPAIHDADQLSLDDVMAALKDLVGRARAGALRSSEMADPTLTVTNLGDQGVEEVYGVIYPPQVALVGFGKVVQRPWAAGGMLGVRPVVRATLAADHRASDGHDGARFLAAVDRRLQSPENL